jgi:hypothetical protein
MQVESGKPEFKLHCTANDTNAQVLLKDLLELLVSFRMGKLAPDMETTYDKREPMMLTVVLYYVTLGYAMPAIGLQSSLLL